MIARVSALIWFLVSQALFSVISLDGFFLLRENELNIIKSKEKKSKDS